MPDLTIGVYAQPEQRMHVWLSCNRVGSDRALGKTPENWSCADVDAIMI